MLIVLEKSDDIIPIATDAIKIKARVLWMQLSVFNEDAAILSKCWIKSGSGPMRVKIEHAEIIWWIKLGWRKY